MIHIDIQIVEKPQETPLRKGGRLEATIKSEQPTSHEVHIAARVMEKLREIANDLSSEPGANVRMLEETDRDLPL